MSSFTIIRDIGKTLENLIETQWGEEPETKDISCPSISFDSPYELMKSGNQFQKLSIFLYQINENIQPRNIDSYVDYGSGSVGRPYPPLSLELLYLITPISTISPAHDAINEKMILGRVMQILYDNPVLPNEKFGWEKCEGSLKHSDSQIRILFRPLSIDDLTKIWTSFHDSPYRLSVAYLVTPIFIDSIMYEGLPKRENKSRILSAQSDGKGEGK